MAALTYSFYAVCTDGGWVPPSSLLDEMMANRITGSQWLLRFFLLEILYNINN